MEALNHPASISGTLTAVRQIERFHRSQSRTDRQVWTRTRVMELFLRILIEGMKELLYVAMVPFAATKLVLNRTRLGHLLPWSVSFGEIADHLKRASRCATALALDFPAIFIDPSKAQARLVNRKLLAVDMQPEPTTFQSLLKYVWTPEVITVAGVVITALVLHRLGLFTSDRTPKNVPSENDPPPITPPSSGVHWLALLAGIVTPFALVLMGIKTKEYRIKQKVKLAELATIPTSYKYGDLQANADYEMACKHPTLLLQPPTVATVNGWKKQYGDEFAGWRKWFSQLHKKLETRVTPQEATIALKLKALDYRYKPNWREVLSPDWSWDEYFNRMPSLDKHGHERPPKVLLDEYYRGISAWKAFLRSTQAPTTNVVRYTDPSGWENILKRAIDKQRPQGASTDFSDSNPSSNIDPETNKNNSSSFSNLSSTSSTTSTSSNSSSFLQIQPNVNPDAMKAPPFRISLAEHLKTLGPYDNEPSPLPKDLDNPANQKLYNKYDKPTRQETRTWSMMNWDNFIASLRHKANLAKSEASIQKETSEKNDKPTVPPQKSTVEINCKSLMTARRGPLNNGADGSLPPSSSSSSSSSSSLSSSLTFNQSPHSPPDSSSCSSSSSISSTLLSVPLEDSEKPPTTPASSFSSSSSSTLPSRINSKQKTMISGIQRKKSKEKLKKEQTQWDQMVNELKKMGIQEPGKKMEFLVENDRSITDWKRLTVNWWLKKMDGVEMDAGRVQFVKPGKKSKEKLKKQKSEEEQTQWDQMVNELKKMGIQEPGKKMDFLVENEGSITDWKDLTVDGWLRKMNFVEMNASHVQWVEPLNTPHPRWTQVPSGSSLQWIEAP